MSVGAHRKFRYRLQYPGDGEGDGEPEPVPEPGDFMVSVTRRPQERWSTYRVLKAVLYRDEVEGWCNGGHPAGALPDGWLCRVLHFRVDCVRVPADEKPEDAMTWRMVADKPNRPPPGV